MGIVRHGLYDKATLFLKEISGIDCFVETGTYKGATAEWAAKHFNAVATIELSMELYEETSKRLSSYGNLTCFQGNSRSILNDIILDAKKPMLFWLDAHWSGGITAGEEDQCPLSDELRIIMSSDLKNVIMIDDARVFLCPPGVPHNPKQFPSISEICEIVKTKPNYLVVLEDVIYIIPEELKTEAVGFFQKETLRSDHDYCQLVFGFEDLHEKTNNGLICRMKRIAKKFIFKNE